MVSGIGIDRAEKKLRSVIAAQEMRICFSNCDFVSTTSTSQKAV